MENTIIVTLRCKDMRSFGRQALTGIWSGAVLATLLMMALSLVPLLSFKLVFDSVTMEKVSDIYTMIVSGPITLGYVYFILAVFRRKSTSPIEVFYGFERFFKALGLALVMSFFIILWALLFIIPGIIASIRYSMAFYILADHPEMGIMDIINESKRLMKGNKLKFFCLQFSFIGWIFLVSLTAGIGSLWLIPYMEASTVGFYELANGNLRPQYPELTANEENGGSPIS